MKKEIWKNYFDVVILPPPEVADYAIKLSREFSRHGTKWTLGKRSFIPHISLYHIPVKPKDFKNFIFELKEIVRKHPSGYLRTSAIVGSVLFLDKPDWIKKLYPKIVRKTFKYLDRDYGVDKFWEINRIPWDRKNAARFIKKYGSPLIGLNFRPHITLASLERKQVILKEKVKPFKFKPKYIYVCELGPSHSCQKIVRKISISQK
jgi:hypothetical protein